MTTTPHRLTPALRRGSWRAFGRARADRSNTCTVIRSLKYGADAPYPDHGTLASPTTELGYDTTLAGCTDRPLEGKIGTNGDLLAPLTPATTPAGNRTLVRSATVGTLTPAAATATPAPLTAARPPHAGKGNVAGSRTTVGPLAAATATPRDNDPARGLVTFPAMTPAPLTPHAGKGNVGGTHDLLTRDNDPRPYPDDSQGICYCQSCDNLRLWAEACRYGLVKTTISSNPTTRKAIK